MPDELVLSVSDFVAVFNQTVEYSYPSITIVGELANFRVSKNKWVYFDLKDEYSSVKFFGTVYQLPGPLEDGLMLQVRGAPRLHNQFGFSVTVQSMQPVGEGSLKKAAALLETKLRQEGLFEPERKRPLPYPPKTVGLIASTESAAFHDFIKVLNARWSGIHILVADVQVQGEVASAQIVAAIEHFNSHSTPVDALVITRGGGSAEDLAAFSTEQVTRAVAGSRIVTMVAIGHEVDMSLAELAADLRGSTPSNAAELLTPDKKDILQQLRVNSKQLATALLGQVDMKRQRLQDGQRVLHDRMAGLLTTASQSLASRSALLQALSPETAMRRGYAVLRSGQGGLLRSGKQISIGDELVVRVIDATIKTTVKEVTIQS
jgi:exodeoxyribonuclease VII large subunit